jgi:mono/diheme cytochrome c family protein
LKASILAAALILSCSAHAQGTEPPVNAGKPPPADAPDFPKPQIDPAAAARGRQTFSTACAFCHGSGARGGEGGGPNLLHSPIVIHDQNGELIAAVVLNGRIDKGMPKFNFPMATVSDIASFLHSLDAGESAAPDFDPKSVLVGNAAAGKVYFNGKGHCTACHSVKKDLAGIGAKYDPPHLQDMIFTAGGTGIFGEPSPTAPPTMVTLVQPSGAVVKGRLVDMDDFTVVLIDAGGNRRTIERNGNVPRVEVSNPLQAHLDMVLNWEDRDLHDVTAYLATLK